jgi:ABC-2 type transport system permease protein
MRLRLFFQVLSLEARSQMSYRGNFWINAIAGFLAEFGVTYCIAVAVFRESGRARIGGYTFQEAVLYFLSVVLLGKLVRGREFEAAISTDIYEGSLTRYLLLPGSYAAFKYAQRLGQLGPGVVQLALFGVTVLAIVGIAPGHGVTAGGAARALAAVAAANVLYFLYDNIIQYIAFWADNVWSLDVAKWFIASILGGYMLPLSWYSDGTRQVLELLPFRYFFDFPARVLLGEIGPYGWLLGMCAASLWGIVAWLAGRLLWHRGQLRYTGVGI